MAFSSGLSVPTMSTHHPAEQRERERQSEAKATQSYTLIAPCRCERKVSQVGATVSAPSLVPQLGAPPVTRKRGPPEESSGRESWDTGATSSSVGHKQA